MKLVFLCIILSISVFLHAQQDFQKIVTNQSDLKQLREKFKNNKFVFQPKEKDISVFDRYVNGNRKLIDSIDVILKSGNEETKKLLVRSMLDKPPSFKFDKEIQNVVLNNLSCDDTNLIWLVGRNKFNRFVEKFESKLPLFSDDCQADMLYWMGVDGTSKIGFTYLKQLLTSSKTDHYKYSNRLPDALYCYMKSPNESVKNMAVDLALEIYSSKIIYKYLVKEDQFTAKDFEEKLLFNILTSGSKKSVPLAKSLYEQKTHQQDALTALILNDHKKYRNELALKINTAGRYEFSKAAVFYLNTSSDISIIPILIEKYFKSKPHDCANFFVTHNLQKELEMSLFRINDKLYIEKVKEELKIRNKSAYDVTLDIYKMGILKESDTLQYAKNIINSQKENQLSIDDKIEPYTYLIYQSPINSNYAWESSDFPILYEEIFFHALKLSENDLGKAQIYSISTLNDDSSLAVHEIFVDFGEIGLNAVHVSNSISPDQKFIFDFLNLIPTKNNSEKKFFHEYFSDSTMVIYANDTVYNEYSSYLKSFYKY